MASGFNENTRVQVPAALHLIKLGYKYLGHNLVFEIHANILPDIFKKAVFRLNPGITETQFEDLNRLILNCLDNDDLGRQFYTILSSVSGIKLIDFNNPDNNDWHCTTELTCKGGDDEYRPDITCFVNGLPLAFIEVKKPNNLKGITVERDRMGVRFRNKAFRRYNNITQLMIFSNNQEYDNENRVPIQGAFYCTNAKDKPFFNVFREAIPGFVENYNYGKCTLEQENEVLRHRNCAVIRNNPEYITNCSVNTPTNRIITSMLSKERFLFLLRYGIAYVEQTVELSDGTKTKVLQKHIMRYQQLFASLAIREKLSGGIKGGIIWHTQGSGKTALAYYSVKNLKDYYAKKQTAVKFYFIVDRLDLMKQASDEFAARGLHVRTAQTRDELMADFRDNSLVANSEGKDEIMVVNIQRFKEDHHKVNINSSYSTNLQRIFFIDEAHRGYSADGSFLANLFDADKDSIKFALTGTPLLKEERESWRVFGDYIDTYYYDKSIADGYTLKLMREPIQTSYVEELENVIEELAGQVEVKNSDFNKDAIIEHRNYLNKLIDFVVDDFRQFRIAQNDKTVGAMIVCKTNQQARNLYALWNERYEAAHVKDLKVASEDPMLYGLTPPKALKAALILHDEGDTEYRSDLVNEYKKYMTIDVLIVNKMLLTGFDAPRLKRLYLGRKLDGHDLLQTLTRVNRPYKDFKYGYVVDFVDIKENFMETNSRYLKELNRTADETTPAEDVTPGEALMLSTEEIKEKVDKIREELFAFTTSDPEIFRQELDEIEDKNRLYEIRRVLEDAKALSNMARAYGDDDMKEKVKSIAEGGAAVLLSEVSHRLAMVNYQEGADHKEDVSAVVNLVLSELDFKFQRGIKEELRIIINDLRDRVRQVQAEFDLNFDHQEDKYVNLSKEFHKYFREKGMVPQDVADAKESIGYMEDVMKKIREINKLNNTLKHKYEEDERYVRIHKRIKEQNEHKDPPIISKSESVIVDGLNQMKRSIDEDVILNWHQIENEDNFKQNVLVYVGKTLLSLNITSSVTDRKYVRDLIANEYIQQYINS